MLKRTRKPTHPGEILKELYLDALNIGISEFAEQKAYDLSEVRRRLAQVKILSVPPLVKV